MKLYVFWQTNFVESLEEEELWCDINPHEIYTCGLWMMKGCWMIYWFCCFWNLTGWFCVSVLLVCLCYFLWFLNDVLSCCLCYMHVCCLLSAPFHFCFDGKSLLCPTYIENVQQFDIWEIFMYKSPNTKGSENNK